ncbi:MAG: hypothetical protein O3A00_16425, partial [Planctomycetota bacterium]|nr:hypothetical protein [Planctomycetota bacterium]
RLNMKLSHIHLIAVLAAVSTSTASAGLFDFLRKADVHKPDCECVGSRTNCCNESCKNYGVCKQPCGHCVPTSKCVDVKKTCFNVECKTICIPAVRLPWQSCCEARCGEVRAVRILKKSSKVVGQKLVCDWTAVSDCCKGTGCNHRGCCDQDPNAAPTPDGLPADVVPPAPPIPATGPTAAIYLPSRILRVSHTLQR